MIETQKSLTTKGTKNTKKIRNAVLEKIVNADRDWYAFPYAAFSRFRQISADISRFNCLACF